MLKETKRHLIECYLNYQFNDIKVGSTQEKKITKFLKNLNPNNKEKDTCQAWLKNFKATILKIKEPILCTVKEIDDFYELLLEGNGTLHDWRKVVKRELPIKEIHLENAKQLDKILNNLKKTNVDIQRKYKDNIEKEKETKSLMQEYEEVFRALTVLSNFVDKNKLKELSELEKLLDKENVDLEHFIEFNGSPTQLFVSEYIFERKSVYRRKRRVVKDLISLYNKLLPISSKLDKPIEELLSKNQKYTPRIDTENILFDSNYLSKIENLRIS